MKVIYTIKLVVQLLFYYYVTVVSTVYKFRW